MQQASKNIDYNELGTIYEQSLDRYVRKHGGIFYTPKYITEYICKNTIGELCKEKKAELQINNLLIDDNYFNRRPNPSTKPKLNKKGKNLFETFIGYGIVWTIQKSGIFKGSRIAWRTR